MINIEILAMEKEVIRERDEKLSSLSQSSYYFVSLIMTIINTPK